MFENIQHIGIPTTNINKIKNYFMDVLGFQLHYETVLTTDKDVKVIFLKYGDLILEVYEVDEEDLADVIGNIDHIAMYHESLNFSDIICAPGNIRLRVTEDPSKRGLNYIAINTNNVVKFIEQSQIYNITMGESIKN